jgi:hypothetical protein
MKCKKCGKNLTKVDRREEMADLNEDATEGQEADYYASELSGDNGAWNISIIEYHCSKCDLLYEVQGEALPDYKELILGWHQKANEGDLFSRFVFEYLAFIAHLKNNLFYDTMTDGAAIQRLKQDSVRHKQYVKKVKIDKQLLGVWNELIKELKKTPLHNSSYDLDYPEIDKRWKGIIQATDDWENMVEFWYSVRNNLFHGGKNPNIQRDRFLVEHAYKTLRAFMDIEIEGLIG